MSMKCLQSLIAFRKQVLTRIFIGSMSRSKLRYFDNAYYLSEQIETKDKDSIAHEIKSGLNTVTDNLREILNKIINKQPPERADVDGGLYVGSAGIAYAFLHVSQKSFLSAKESKEYLSLAHRYLDLPVQQILSRASRIDSGFLLGDAGILAVGAVAAAISNNNETASDYIKFYLQVGERCKRIDFLKCGSDELFVGRAGYLYGAFYLNRVLKKTVVPIKTIHEIGRVIVSSGRKYARSHGSPCPLMYSYYDTEYLGAAHGLCAILQALIQAPGFLDTDKETENAVRVSVDYVLSLQTPSGNFPCALDEIDSEGWSLRPEEDELVHWCHGAPGVIYLMAAAYLRWKDPRYLEACQRAGDLVWQKGLLKKGPGICHGVAGNGYVFLLLYRLTSDKVHLYRATKFADFLKDPLFLQEARTPDQPYSLYEGLAGTACFLTDLIEPDQAAFPFQDVFN